MRQILTIVFLFAIYTQATAQSAYTQRLIPEAQATETEICENQEIEVNVLYTLPANRSVLFNGLNEHINFSPDPVFDFGATTNFTVEFWVNPSAATPGVMVSKGNAIINQGFIIGYTGVLSVILGDGTNIITLTGNDPVPQSNWTHVAVVVDRTAGIVTTYLNSLYDNSVNLTGLGNINSPELLRVGAAAIGGGVIGAYFNGYIDELRVWDVALSAAQISSRMMLHVNPNSVSNLIGNWDFNELMAPTMIDCSTTGANGQIVNSASLSANSPPLAFSFLPRWNTGQTGNSIFANPLDTTTYVVEIGYCKYLSIDSVTVNVIPCEPEIEIRDAVVWAPNAFTPNGDRKNDLFEVQASFIDYYEIQIFNRLGNAVYHSFNILSPWDGTIFGKGEDYVQEGVYVYLITYRDLRGIEFEKRGYITLMR